MIPSSKIAHKLNWYYAQLGLSMVDISKECNDEKQINENVGCFNYKKNVEIYKNSFYFSKVKCFSILLLFSFLCFSLSEQKIKDITKHTCYKIYSYFNFQHWPHIYHQLCIMPLQISKTLGAGLDASSPY